MKKQHRQKADRFKGVCLKAETKEMVEDVKDRLNFPSLDHTIAYLVKNSQDMNIMIKSEFMTLKNLVALTNPNDKDMLLVLDLFEKSYIRVSTNPTEMHDLQRILVEYVSGKYKLNMRKKEEMPKGA